MPFPNAEKDWTRWLVSTSTTVVMLIKPDLEVCFAVLCCIVLLCVLCCAVLCSASMNALLVAYFR
jgi:hypothetical protein